VVEPQPLLAQWKAVLTANRTRIAGNAWLCCGFESDGDVSFSRAKIGGKVYAFGGIFINPRKITFDASRSERDGDIWFTPFPLFPSPEVDGLIDINGAARH